MKIEKIEDGVVLMSGNSGDYTGFIENGNVSFSVIYDDVELDNDNWEEVLGDDHLFVKLFNYMIQQRKKIDVEVFEDYVMLSMGVDDLLNVIK